MFGFDKDFMKEDPYQLLGVSGLSFESDNRIGICMGFTEDGIVQFCACINDGLISNRTENAALLHDDFVKVMTGGKYHYEESRVCELVPQMIEERVIFRTEYNGIVYLSTPITMRKSMTLLSVWM